jgi:tRNA(Ile)-lysidine synthase
VVALHVHHGLSANADAWLSHCESACLKWAKQGLPVRFVAQRLSERPRRGDSVEAWARKARYRALREMASEAGADLVLLAHHRRDQAETFFLQALRGSGAAGLSAMPRTVRRDGVTWARPWLDRPREAIEAYRRTHRLRHVEDESNGDPRFARNRLRAVVWPALVGAFPDAEAALADASRRAQDGAAAMAELAVSDLAAVSVGDALDIAAWRALSPARRRGAFLAWLRARSDASSPGSLVDRIDAALAAKGTQRFPVPGGELRAYRGALRFHGSAPVPIVEVATAGAVSSPPDRSDAARLGHTRRYPDWHGALVGEPVADGGIAADVFERLVPRARRSADRFQAGPGRPPRSLKLQFQAAGVPAWDRDAPVFCAGDRLVFVPGLGIDARALAAPGAIQLRLRWLRR